MANIDRIINQEQGDYIIDELKNIVDTYRNTDRVPENAAEISIVYDNPLFGLEYRLNGEKHTSVPMGGAATNTLSIFADMNSTVVFVSFYGKGTSWKLANASSGFEDHGDDSRYVNVTEAVDTTTDRVSINIGEDWGGFKIAVTTAGKVTFSNAWGGCYGETIRKVMMAHTYTVTYNANGGTGTVEDQIVYGGLEYTLRDNTFTRDGYFFAGWSTDPDAGLADSPNSSTESDADVPKTVWYNKQKQNATTDNDLTYYAIWSNKAFVNIGSYQRDCSANYGDDVGSVTGLAKITSNYGTGLKELSIGNTITMTLTIGPFTRVGTYAQVPPKYRVTFNGSEYRSDASDTYSVSKSYRISKAGIGSTGGSISTCYFGNGDTAIVTATTSASGVF